MPSFHKNQIICTSTPHKPTDQESRIKVLNEDNYKYLCWRDKKQKLLQLGLEPFLLIWQSSGGSHNREQTFVVFEHLEWFWTQFWNSANAILLNRKNNKTFIFVIKNTGSLGLEKIVCSKSQKKTKKKNETLNVVYYYLF